MSIDKLEQLFKTAETEKTIPLSTGAWNRMDDMLQKDKLKPKFSKIWMMGIAASFIILFGVLFLFNNQSDSDYILEQLVIDKNDIIYSSSEVAHLNSEHQYHTLQKLRPFYNESGKVKATIN